MCHDWLGLSGHSLLKQNKGLITGNVQERVLWALVDPTQVIERSAEIKPENRK